MNNFEETGRLTPDDTAFLDYVNRKINQASALGLELPFQAIYDNIVDAALYFWEWEDTSTQSQLVGLRSSEIKKNLDGQGNAIIQMPEWVQFITGFKPAQITFGSPILSDFNTSALKSYDNSNSFRDMDFQMSDSMANLFEVNMYRSVLYHGITHNYNTNSQILTILGRKDCNIALEVERRLDFKFLYKNRLFRNYVVGMCLENLSDVVGTYDFELPNGVKINYERIQAKGEKLIEKVEEEIKTSVNTTRQIFR